MEEMQRKMIGRGMKKCGILICMILVVCSFCSLKVLADCAPINSLFMKPDMDLEGDPSINVIYQSSDLSVLAVMMPRGINAVVIAGNGKSVKDSVDELNANVAGYYVSDLSIYTNGESVPGEALDALANAKWKNVEIYYYDYMVRCDLLTGLGDQAPYAELIEDDRVAELLQRGGYTGRYITGSLSGWSPSKESSFYVYKEGADFPKDVEVNCYKYDEASNRLLYMSDGGYYSDYTINQFAFGHYACFWGCDGDGIYIITEKPLTEEQMSPPPMEENTGDAGRDESAGSGGKDASDSAGRTDGGAAAEGTGQSSSVSGEEEQAPPADENAGNDDSAEHADGGAAEKSEEHPALVGKEDAEPYPSDVEKTEIVQSADKSVSWNFGGRDVPEDFLADAVISAAGKSTVQVSFAYEGPLPGETEVTISLPAGVFEDREELYLYYCNPKNGKKEFVDSGVCSGTQVTFTMTHCSDYVITSVRFDAKEKTGRIWWWIGGSAVFLAVVATLVLIRARKKISEK